MSAKAKTTMSASKPLFYEFTTKQKYGVPSRNFLKKNVLCEKGDEITRFDGTYLKNIFIKKESLIIVPTM